MAGGLPAVDGGAGPVPLRPGPLNRLTRACEVVIRNRAGQQGGDTIRPDGLDALGRMPANLARAMRAAQCVTYLHTGMIAAMNESSHLTTRFAAAPRDSTEILRLASLIQ